jgi:hypothetical protein
MKNAPDADIARGVEISVATGGPGQRLRPGDRHGLARCAGNERIGRPGRDDVADRPLLVSVDLMHGGQLQPEVAGDSHGIVHAAESGRLSRDPDALGSRRPQRAEVLLRHLRGDVIDG